MVATVLADEDARQIAAVQVVLHGQISTVQFIQRPVFSVPPSGCGRLGIHGVA